jgi:hypothetical protein
LQVLGHVYRSTPVLQLNKSIRLDEARKAFPCQRLEVCPKNQGERMSGIANDITVV